jgi:hypothetical protein
MSAIILHAAHVNSGSIQGWLILLPLLPAAALALMRLGIWLWPGIQGRFDSDTEPL